MKVVISHCYSNDNSGDAALLAALIADVRRAFENVELVALTMDAVEPSMSFEGVPMTASFMYYAFNTTRSRLAKLVTSVFIMTATLAWALASRIRVDLPLPPRLEQLCVLYRDADMVVTVGGGYLRGKPGLASTVTLSLLVHPIWLAAVLRTPTVLYPQSIGPFGSRMQRSIVRHSLNNADMVMTREDISTDVIADMNVNTEVVRAVDGAFALPDQSLKTRVELPGGVSPRRPVVGITVRAWLADERQTAFEKSVAGLCDYLVAQGHSVVFIPQVTSVHHSDDDREVAARVQAFMAHGASADVILENLDYTAVRKLCGGVDYLVGTRFHSVIFALCGRVPACAIEYEHKTTGIMRDLDLEQWVVGIEDVTTPRLVTMMENLIAAREQYESHLNDVIPPYISRAKSTYQHLQAVGVRLGLDVKPPSVTTS